MSHTSLHPRETRSKTIIALMAILWLVLTAIGAWNIAAFAIGALAAAGLGTYLISRAVAGAGER